MNPVIRIVSVLLVVVLTGPLAAGQGARGADADRKAAPAVSQGPYNPSRTLKNDLLHTRLDLRFDWVRQWVHGVARLRFKPYFYPQNTVDIDAKGFDVKGVFLLDTLKTGETVFDTLNYTYNDRRKLHVLLPRTYTRADTFDVQVVYTAKPNELPLGGSEAITQDKGLYFINHDGAEGNKPRQIWTQGETEANSCWFPTIDTPNEKMTQEIYLTVDSKFRTLSNGKLISSTVNGDNTRTDYWKQSLPHAPYLAMIAVGEFAYVRDSIPATADRGGLEVSYFVEPAYEKAARAIFGRTPAMIDFFEKKFGVPYVWEKYSQIAVRDFVSGAMENTTATVHAETVQLDERQLIDGNSDDVISHELFHHWFGNLVTCESWANLPLNEAFATYAEYLWREHTEGAFSADMHGLDDQNQYLAEAETKQEPLIRYHYTDREQMFDSHSYAKGGRILHLLRRQVGDDAFFEACRRYLNRHRFGTAEVSDLREAFEEVTGEDLNWFFEQWFMKPGHAVIKVEKDYKPGSGQVSLTVFQQQDTTRVPIYRLPVKVDVWSKGQKKSYDVLIDRAKQTLTFPVEQRPDLVLFDADHRIVGTVDQEKNKAELVFQYYNSDSYLDKYESVTRLEDKSNLIDSTVRHMMLTAMTDKFWKIRQLAVANFAEYDGQEFSEVERVVQSKARNDEKSHVRQEAINTLASFGDNVNDPLFREMLNDTSYAVVSSALDAYLMSKPGDAGEIAARFENVPNGDIVTAVANFYANSTDTSRYTWFINKMQTMKSQDLYNFLQVFGKYLIRSGADMQRQSVPMLEVMARTNPAYFVRFGAYQVLGLLQDIEGVKSMRKDIRLSERDPKLKEMYEQFKDF
ncbi:M1 family aminopeptidase [Larkinella soli]|uniref:M1 family aminopeptidase n=1 Tax=Larkinella soli TaxID=1770527 RepID=UPI000FFC7E36|nr:M1 family aminopeptidase [Larkinella soli]